MLSQEGVNNPKTTYLEAQREWIRRASQGWPEPPGENRPLWETILRIVAAATIIGSLIPVAPAETETQEPEQAKHEFIYREGTGPKALQLHKDIDYRTGLSFYVWNESIKKLH